ncbi:hypothetical protein BH09ACT8_BH09ACT8_30820 [soil metagenome]
MSDMAHCSVLTCDNEATTAFAFWVVCDEHGEQLTSGSEYRRQGSEESATGMASPALLMGQSLRDLNEYIVIEPPTVLTHDSDCPEGALIPLRVRRRGDTESDLTLVLSDEVLARLADMLRRFAPPE